MYVFIKPVSCFFIYLYFFIFQKTSFMFFFCSFQKTSFINVFFIKPASFIIIFYTKQVSRMYLIKHSLIHFFYLYLPFHSFLTIEKTKKQNRTPDYQHTDATISTKSSRCVILPASLSMLHPSFVHHKPLQKARAASTALQPSRQTLIQQQATQCMPVTTARSASQNVNSTPHSV